MTAQSTASSAHNADASHGFEGPTPADSTGTVESWWGDAPSRAVIGHTLLAVGAAMLAGIALGLVWRWVTPPIEVTVGAGVSAEEANRVFGAEGVYTAIMVVAGLASAILARGWLRHAGPLAVLGVVAAGIVGGVVAWRVGVWAGPERLVDNDGLTDGQVVQAQLGVHSHGLLLAWSITAVFTLLWIAALSPDPSAEGPPDAAAADRATGSTGDASGGEVGVTSPATTEPGRPHAGESSRPRSG